MQNTPIPTVFVVDDDVSVRESLELLVQSAGWQSQTFSTASDFLASPKQVVPCCMVLDVNLPDLNGLELQERIAAERSEMPIIFLSGHVDIPMTVRAMKRGALEFLTKPFDSDTLLNAVRYAIRRSEVTLRREMEFRTLRADFDALTSREREVMALVATGLLNKQVGLELGISEITVKAHRGNVMRKMRADSFAQLVNMASRLRLSRQLAASAA
jgi:FixJ family two-component response regulator